MREHQRWTRTMDISSQWYSLIKVEVIPGGKSILKWSTWRDRDRNEEKISCCRSEFPVTDVFHFEYIFPFFNCLKWWSKTFSFFFAFLLQEWGRGPEWCTQLSYLVHSYLWSVYKVSEMYIYTFKKVLKINRQVHALTNK